MPSRLLAFLGEGVGSMSFFRGRREEEGRGRIDTTIDDEAQMIKEIGLSIRAMSAGRHLSLSFASCAVCTAWPAGREGTCFRLFLTV